MNIKTDIRTSINSRSFIHLLLSPPVLIGGPYLLALLLYFTSPEPLLVFCRVKKPAADIGNIFVLLAFITVMAGSVLGMLVGRITIPHKTYSSRSTNILFLLFLISAALAIVACALETIIIWRLVKAVGGVDKFLSLIRYMSFTEMAGKFKEHSFIRGVTTFVHLGTAASVLSGYVAGQTRSRSKLLFLFSLIIPSVYWISCIPRTIILAERLALIVPIIGFTTAYIIARLHSTSLSGRKILLIPIVTLVMFGGIWLAGVVTRPIRFYKDNQAAFNRLVGKRVKPNSVSGVIRYSQLRLGAYLYTSINNQAHLVKHLKERTHFYYSFKWLCRGLGLMRDKWQPVLRREKQLRKRLPQMHPEYTSFGAAGYLFTDQGWLAIGYMGIIGVLLGFLFMAVIRKTLWGSLIYPLCVPPMLDMYRSHMLGDSRFTIPFLVILGIVIILLLKKKIKIA